MLERLVADWPVKLLALALAIVIWATVTGEESIRRDFDVALDPLLGEHQMVASPLPHRVTVRLEGPASVIRKIDELALAVRPDLTDKPAGTRDVHLVDGDLVGKPPRARVSFFEPDRVSLFLDERVTRRVPVTPSLVGKPSAGYVLYSASVRPDTVLIEGPASQVEPLEGITTEPIALEGRTQSIIQTVDAISVQPQVRILNPTATAFEVRLEIDVAPGERTLESIPVMPSPQEFAVTFSPPVVSVVLSGPPALLERIARAQVLVTGEVSLLVADGSAQRITPLVTLELPPEQTMRVSVKSVRPQHITARSAATEPTS